MFPVIVNHIDEPSQTLVVKKDEPVLIRPASTTYKGLYYLSEIDHSVMRPLEIVCSLKGNVKESAHYVCEVLKKGLAELLVYFYPLAGKLIMTQSGRYMVDCTGEGVYFVEALVDHDLDEFGDISLPDQAKLRPLVHVLDADNIFDAPLLTVQVTMFKCGGFILGIAYNHIMMDGGSFGHFLNSWSELCEGSPLSLPPFLDRSIMKLRQVTQDEIPPHLLTKYDGFFAKSDTTYYDSNVVEDEENVFTSFHLSSEKLMELQKTVMEEGIEKPPTKFVLATSFLWRAIVKSTKAEQNPPTKLLFPVDFRTRFGSQLPKGYFGNAIGLACVRCNTEEQLAESSLSSVVKQVQEALQLATIDNVQSICGYMEATGLRISQKNVIYFSDLTRMPFRNTGMGLGKPKQFGYVTTSGEDAVFLVAQDKSDINSVTAVMCLPPSTMKNFQECMS